MARVTVVTLGCKANQYDSEQLKNEFQKRGWDVVDAQQDPDVLLVNSCTVTNEAARQSRQRLRKIKGNPKRPFLVLWGCYPQAYPGQTEKIPGVDLVLGRKEMDQTVEIIEEKSGLKSCGKGKIEQLPFSARTRAFLKIEEGCESFCSYCIVPRARGRVWSKPLDQVMQEVEILLERGFKEIVLTGIHLGYYGKDRGGETSLEQVIKEILQKTPLPRLRLSSLEINEVSEELLELMGGDNALCPHLHLPLQSGSDKILQRMNRKYLSGEYLEKALYFQGKIPDLGVTTDIMVGFPGETDTDFARTVELVENVGFSRIHVFSFSKRAGTPAAGMEGQVPGPEKKRRNRVLRDIGNKQQAKFNSLFLDREMDVLVESSAPVQGWSPNYIRYYIPREYNPGQVVRVKGKNLFRDGIWGKEG